MSEDLTQLRRAPHIPRAIDNTALQAYMECNWKYFASMVENRRRGGSTRPSIAYGTTWHSIMEAHYKTGGDPAAVQRAAIMSWEAHDNPDDHRTLDRALSAYEAYLERYGDHDTEAKTWGITLGYPDTPVVENSVELSWPGALHPYTGKIDRIFEKNGSIYVQDHKTTSQLGSTYFRQFDPSNQMMGYTWLAQKLTGLPIAGVEINAHGVLKTQNKFERQTILYSPERLEEWARNYNSWIRKIEHSMQELERAQQAGDGVNLEGVRVADVIMNDAFPRNLNACAGKYGMCTYTEVCTYPERLRGRILASEFEENPWDPMNADEDAATGGEA